MWIVGGRGDGAGVENDQPRVGRAGHGRKTFGGEASFNGSAIGLRGSDRLPETVGDTRSMSEALGAGAASIRRSNEPAWLAHTIYNRVIEKLKREPVEDFRIDFEDGYGNRPDDEEDGHAASAGWRAGSVGDRRGHEKRGSFTASRRDIGDGGRKISRHA